jgi:hypothetical protein
MRYPSGPSWFATPRLCAAPHHEDRRIRLWESASNLAVQRHAVKENILVAAIRGDRAAATGIYVAGSWHAAGRHEQLYT